VRESPGRVEAIDAGGLTAAAIIARSVHDPVRVPGAPAVAVVDEVGQTG
jgi:hypothetical protein